MSTIDVMGRYPIGSVKRSTGYFDKCLSRVYIKIKGMPAYSALDSLVWGVQGNSIMILVLRIKFNSIVLYKKDIGF